MHPHHFEVLDDGGEGRPGGGGGVVGRSYEGVVGWGDVVLVVWRKG